jgi:HAD superfamily hydrolase (TIGR01490 family)
MKPRKFAAFDIDGTIFRWQLYHELVFDLIDHDVLPATIKDEIAPSLANWQSRAGKAAFTDYELTLVGIFAKHLAGLSVEEFKQGAARVIERSSDKVYAYTRDLLTRLKSEGYILVALSGSFAEVVEPFAKKYHFDYWAGTECEIKNGHFTGKVVWNYDKKAQNLAELIPGHNLTLAGSIAVGDTASDIPMLELVEHPIAFNPNQELFDHAAAHAWNIVVERKNVIYELKPEAGKYQLIHSADGS